MKVSLIQRVINTVKYYFVRETSILFRDVPLIQEVRNSEVPLCKACSVHMFYKKQECKKRIEILLCKIWSTTLRWFSNPPGNSRSRRCQIHIKICPCIVHSMHHGQTRLHKYMYGHHPEMNFDETSGFVNLAQQKKQTNRRTHKHTHTQLLDLCSVVCTKTSGRLLHCVQHGDHNRIFRYTGNSQWRKVEGPFFQFYIITTA